MTTADLLPAPSLQRTKLRWTAFAGLAAGLLVAVAVAFRLSPLQGRADFAVVFVLAYLVAQTALSWPLEGRRIAVDRLFTAVVTVGFGLAVLPLVLVLGYTVSKGLHRLDGTFLTHSMNNIAEAEPAGGAYHAILGTLEQVGIATLLAVPLALLVAIYLSEYARGWLGRLVGILVDVMTGLPSIVAGLFVLALWVLALHQGYSGFGGALALSVLMLPTVVRSAQEVLRLVPDALREGGLALGLPRWRVITAIVLPTAVPGIATGVILGISRVAGETAPLLLTVFGAAAINSNPFRAPQGALPLFIFSEAGQPTNAALDRAWAAGLTLIAIIMALNLLARVIASRVGTRGGGR